MPTDILQAMQPVSVIMTVLNEVEEIGRGVSSLLAQEPSPAEVVVVDGGSADGTWEWLTGMQARDARLVAIRDETCSLKHSDGPISKGRNVAIRAARSAILACADAGCTYAPDWLANLTAPLVAGDAEYALGGTCLDLRDATVWDIASAPFFSVKLSPTEPTKSCTARSMAFTRALWERIGGFPEQVAFGEDTLYDVEARRRTRPAFIANAKAIYRPQNSFRTATRQMARYAASDGMAGVRWSRLMRNGLRCVGQVAALALLPWTVWPFVAIAALESWYAFRRDGRFLLRQGLGAGSARFAFSVAVPWVVAVNQAKGRLRPQRQTNWQNRDQGSGTRD